MEIALLSPSSIKIRSKLANFVVDPVSATPKTDADVIINLSGSADASRVTDFRLVISGPGEYELKGVKISSEKNKSGDVYNFSLDKMNVCLAKGSTLSKTDKSTDANIVVVNADELPGDKAITAMTPSVVVFYGEKAAEAAKSLKESAPDPINKYTVTFEKLPQEMEVIVLG